MACELSGILGIVLGPLKPLQNGISPVSSWKLLFPMNPLMMRTEDGEQQAASEESALRNNGVLQNSGNSSDFSLDKVY